MLQNLESNTATIYYRLPSYLRTRFSNLLKTTFNRKKQLKLKIVVQLNLFNTDTKGTEPSVRFTEVSVL